MYVLDPALPPLPSLSDLTSSMPSVRLKPATATVKKESQSPSKTVAKADSTDAAPDARAETAKAEGSGSGKAWTLEHDKMLLLGDVFVLLLRVNAAAIKSCII